MSKYGWKQLSQWDMAPDDAHIEYKSVETGLSKAICRYMLVEWTYQGSGIMKFKYIPKSEVSTEMLSEAKENNKILIRYGDDTPSGKFSE